MFFADVIFAFTAPYIIWFFFFPVAVLALFSEMVVYKIAYRRLPAFSIFASTLGANAASWLVGLVLSILLLPSGLVRKKVDGSNQTYLTAGPNFFSCFVLAFGVALILSIVIEWGVWRMLFRKPPLNSLGLTSALANVVSYAIVICFFLCFDSTLNPSNFLRRNHHSKLPRSAVLPNVAFGITLLT